MKIKSLTSTLAAVVMVLLAACWAAADAPPGPYFNGFETDTAGWFNFSGATVTRVPSGSASTYANGVAAADGSYYARLGIDPSPDSCTFGGGTPSLTPAPEMRMIVDGLRATFGFAMDVEISLEANPGSLSTEYLRDLRKLLDDHHYVGDFYGHFGQGCLHTRIDFDLETAPGTGVG